ncbi:MAG: hypothetical protein HY962_09640 [Ignavibacteriae bacterium]|nr:hypothetical protein [Ignavibacteriota bacterium]
MPCNSAAGPRTRVMICMLFACIVASACNSDDATSPGTSTQSTASFILNGGTYSNTAVELRDNTHGIWRISANGRLLGVLDCLGTFGATSSKRVVFTVVLPVSTPGTHTWIDPKGAVLSASGVFLDVYDQGQSARSYTAVEGSSVITQVADKGGQVVGTFSGLLRSSSDGSIITISNGAFSLTRLSDQ